MAINIRAADTSDSDDLAGFEIVDRYVRLRKPR